MEIVKLKGAQVPYIWGGDNLAKSFGKEAGESIGESWEVSYDEKNPCYIASGEHVGKRLKDVATAEDIGSNSDGMPFFPLLIKFIDAKDDLSVQVHPTDEFALKNENQYGKTEMWYVLDAKEDAKLCCGLKEDVDREEMMSLMQSGEIMDKLNFVNVKAGDVFFIESGTIHAIGKGITVYEVQQNSTLTYRLFDYLRQDKNGNYRELHTEKAKIVSNLKKQETVLQDGNKTEVLCNQNGNYIEKTTLATCKYFTCNQYKFNGETEIVSAEKSFMAFTCVNGSGKLNSIEFSCGDTIFVPANSGILKIVGEGTFVESEV